MRNLQTSDWEKIFFHLRSYLDTLPSLSLFSKDNASPYRILIATIISLRTKDQVTLSASQKLFALADTPQDMLGLNASEIAHLIFPAGFYKKKAENILAISRILIEEYKAQVPSREEALLSLPGVGRKTANLVLGLAFGIPAICVDTHVHRIANRMGWIVTTYPEDSEEELRSIVPREYWIELNTLLVNFGQRICKPTSPLCSKCIFDEDCPKRHVYRRR